MDVGTLATGQQVTVLVKIITVGSAVVVKSELQKQECVVGDVSGCCRIVLWNDDIGKLLKEKSYELSYVIVKQWDGVKYLSVSKGSEIDSVCVQEWRRRGKLTVCLMVKLRFRLGLVTEKPLAHCTSR